jgi:hypothetical protein
MAYLLEHKAITTFWRAWHYVVPNCRKSFAWCNVGRSTIRWTTVHRKLVKRNWPVCATWYRKLTWTANSQRTGNVANCIHCSCVCSVCWVCIPCYRERLQSARSAHLVASRHAVLGTRSTFVHKLHSPSPPNANLLSRNNFKYSATLPTISTAYRHHSLISHLLFNDTSTVPDLPLLFYPVLHIFLDFG